MAKLIWNESLSVNDEELDRQHQELIRLYNNVHEALIGDSIEEVQTTKLETISSLGEYADKHFGAEETYLRKIDYPDLENHQALHRTFKDKVQRLQKEVKEDQIILATSLIKILRNWISDHLVKEDGQYRDFAKNHK